MTAICFVCNLPILSHQVGLVWQGGNGWDDYMREQLEESTLKARLGGRRDSSAQITTISPPTETQETSPPRRRRRSSLAQLTDILKDWGGSATRKRNKELVRRETLADLAKSLPWPRSDTNRKRRESSVDSGVKSSSSRSHQDGQYSTARADIYQLLNRSTTRRPSNTVYTSDVRRSSAEAGRRGSGESGKSSRRGSITTSSPKHTRRYYHPSAHRGGRRDSRPEVAPYRTEDRRTSIGADLQPPPAVPAMRIDSCTQALPPPTIITSSVTSPSTSPSISPPCHSPLAPEPPRDSPPSRPTSPQPSATVAVTVPAPPATTASATVSTATIESGPVPTTASSPTHPLVSTRRDSTTQVSFASLPWGILSD